MELNNLKLQQALMGLSVRQAAVAGGVNGPVGGTLSELRNSKDANYTQRDAQQVIDSNSADENATLMKLAGRLIQQQDAAVANPAVIRANIPEQGRLLAFKRPVVVDTWADLNIKLEARVNTVAAWNFRIFVLSTTALILAGLYLLTRQVFRQTFVGPKSHEVA